MLPQPLDCLTDIYHLSQAHAQTTDLWWDDGEVLEEKRGHLSEIRDLYCCWNPRVQEKDLHHSVSVHAGDLETRATASKWPLNQADLSNCTLSKHGQWFQ